MSASQPPGIGVDAIGTHVPALVIERSELAASWGTGGRGRRSVANYDEDVVTMGVSAAADAMRSAGTSSEQIGAILFATTSPVFLERQHAAIVADALGISGALCLDVTGSIRSGVDAVLTGRLLVASGAIDRVLVVASDRRTPTAGGAAEARSGDGAAAVVLARGPRILEIDSAICDSDSALSIWRLAVGGPVRSGDDRFVARELLEPWLLSAVDRATESIGLDPSALSTGVLTAAAPRSGESAARTLGLRGADGSATVEAEIGYTGVAAPFLGLVAAFDGWAADQTVVLASSGDGASAVVARIVSPDRLAERHAALSAKLTTRKAINAGLFQRLRGQLPSEPVDPFTSEVILRREQDSILGLIAGRCRKCARLEYPARRVCAGCGAIDLFDREALPRTGTLFTFTTEHLFPNPLNELTMGVVNVGDARLYVQIADAEPTELRPGLNVELVLRILHEGGGVPQYFWKARVIGGQDG